MPGHSDTPCKMRGRLRLGVIRKLTPPDQPAIGQQEPLFRAEGDLDRECAGLLAIKLERRQKVNILDRLDVPVGSHAKGSLRKRLDPNHARQYRGALDAM